MKRTIIGITGASRMAVMLCSMKPLAALAQACNATRLGAGRTPCHRRGGT